MIFQDIMDYYLIKISFQILMIGEVGRVGRGRGSPKEFKHVQFQVNIHFYLIIL